MFGRIAHRLYHAIRMQLSQQPFCPNLADELLRLRHHDFAIAKLDLTADGFKVQAVGHAVHDIARRHIAPFSFVMYSMTNRYSPTLFSRSAKFV